MLFSPRTFAIAIVMLCVGGCALNQQQTPQQRFAKALATGNSAEAADIWRHMTPDQKEAFALSNGMQPDPADAEAARKQAAEAAAQEPDAELNGDDEGRSGKTLTDYFNADSGTGAASNGAATNGGAVNNGSKSSMFDDNGRSGRTLEDYIPYMKNRRLQDLQSQQAPEPSEPAPPELYTN
jgi:hypothetical protein